MKAAQKFFQDKSGNYAVWQTPNVLMYLIALAFLGRLLSDSSWYVFFDLLFFGAGFAWSYLEIRYGASPFRRVLGALVLVALFATRLQP